MPTKATKNSLRDERDKLPDELFGDPERRLFPIKTKLDVENAKRVVDLLPNSAQIIARIDEIAVKNAIFSEKSTKKGENHDYVEFSVDFDEEGVKVEQDPDLGPVVVREGKVFEADRYADKKFELTPEEMLLAVKNFEKAVPINIEHGPSFLDGKLGKVTEISADDTGWGLKAKVAVPLPLHQLTKGEPIKVSAEWDRKSKSFEAMAYVRNPRVKTAALMAAFTADAVAKDEGFAEYLTGWFSERLADFDIDPTRTWNGQSTLQMIHNELARAGAICDPANDRRAEMDDRRAEMHSAAEQRAIQTVHDMVIAAGAKCDFLQEGEQSGCYPYFADSETGKPDSSGTKNSTKSGRAKKMSDKKTLKEKLLAFLSSEPDEDTPAPDNSSVEKRNTGDGARGRVIETTKPDAEKEEEASKTDAADTSRKSTGPAKSSATSTSSDADKTGKVKASSDDARSSSSGAPGRVEMSAEDKAEFDRIKRELDTVKQQNAEIAALRLSEEAEKFADEMVRSERAYPAEREVIVANFKQARTDDQVSATKVKFSANGKEVEGNRVDALKAIYAVRQPHNLTVESLAVFGAGLLPNEPKTAEGELKDAVKLAEEFADSYNRRVQRSRENARDARDARK